MGLPESDLNLGQKIKKGKLKKKIEFFFILVLDSNLSYYSFHLPLLRTLKNYFLYANIFLEFYPRIA